MKIPELIPVRKDETKHRMTIKMFEALETLSTLPQAKKEFGRETMDKIVDDLKMSVLAYRGIHSGGSVLCIINTIKTVAKEGDNLMARAISINTAEKKRCLNWLIVTISKVIFKGIALNYPAAQIINYRSRLRKNLELLELQAISRKEETEKPKDGEVSAI